MKYHYRMSPGFFDDTKEFDEDEIAFDQHNIAEQGG